MFDQRRSEERNPTRPSARKHISAPPNAAGGVCSSSYKHATPNVVKPVTLFFTASAVGGCFQILSTLNENCNSLNPTNGSWWMVQILSSTVPYNSKIRAVKNFKRKSDSV